MSDSPLYDRFRTLKVPMSVDDFERLPIHPGYKTEYVDGHLRASPRWRTLNAFLPLDDAGSAPAADLEGLATIRLLADDDWAGLPGLFARSFGSTPPFGILVGDDLVEAARAWLDRARQGGDGPVVGPASVVAVDPDGVEVLGASIVTLLDPRNRHFFDEKRQDVPPPRAEGAPWPHLTWIFVDRDEAGQGIATALLGASARALLGLGHRELATTIHRGNDVGMAWHWRNGFRLLPEVSSARRLRLRGG